MFFCFFLKREANSQRDLKENGPRSKSARGERDDRVDGVPDAKALVVGSAARQTIPSAPHSRARGGGEASDRVNMFTTPTQSSSNRPTAAEALTPTPFSLSRRDNGNTPQCAATPSRLKCIADLKGELTCGICLEVCVKPSTTICGHNFCQNCLKALHKTCRDQGKPAVECPKCRKRISGGGPGAGKENGPGGDCSFEVNSALWNVIQLLFPRLELKSPQWKLKTPVPAASPMTSNFNDSARMMLSLAEEGSADDRGDLDGEGPVLDLTNHLWNLRGGRAGPRAEMRRRSGPLVTPGGDGGADDGARDRSDGGAVPRAGFTTAREMLMRNQAAHRSPAGRRAPHEFMDYA